MSYSDIYAYFCFRGDFDPDIITHAVNILPTKIYRKGEQHPGFKIKHLHPRSSWRVNSGLGRDQDLEDHVSDVIAKLDGSWGSIQELSQKYEASLVCVVHSYGGDCPYIGLARNTLRKLGELNASFDVDLYMTPDKN